MSKRTIKRNAARCRLCDDVVVSEHRHDFRTCKCGSLSVDGGLDYLKRGYTAAGSYEDLSEYEEQP